MKECPRRTMNGHTPREPACRSVASGGEQCGAVWRARLQMEDTAESSPPQAERAPWACNLTAEECGEEAEWLEEEVAGMRLWQLVGIVLSVVLALTVLVCCCVKFRIPRTKQEIEADYARKKLARSFRRQLAKISDKDMDEMDLRRALDCVRAVLDAVETDRSIAEQKIIYEATSPSLAKNFNSMMQGMRVRFNKDKATEFNGMI